MSYLVRRAVAELLGTGFLVAAVIGSGVMAVQLSPHDIGLQLLENSIATGAALLALIIAFGSVSAAFNPVVTLVEVARGNVWLLEGVALVAAQLVGAFLGAVAANLMFDLSAVSISTHHRATPAHLFAEVVATVGLLLVIHGALRRTHLESIALAVAAYIAAAYWFTSSTSFANPAVTAARMFSDTFAGIAPASVLPFVAAQVAGGVIGFLLISFLHPKESA